MPTCTPLKIVVRRFEDAVQWLSDHGFQVNRPSGGPVTVTKNQCTAQIEPGNDGHARIVAFPARIVSGEPAALIDRGYQKVFKNSKVEVAATAENLQALHGFSEELKEALGYTSLYNEGLGSVSGRYQYDRVVGRDLPEASRPQRSWQK